MYKTALVNSDISDGKRVVEEVERMMPITAAFWFYREEDDEWKLVIVTPEIASKGPINLYSKVAVLLNDLSVDAHSPVVMPLSRITLTTQSSPSYQRIKEFGDAMGDALIYKMG